jgi:hypothetical protein
LLPLLFRMLRSWLLFCLISLLPSSITDCWPVCEAGRMGPGMPLVFPSEDCLATFDFFSPGSPGVSAASSAIPVAN